MRAKSASVGASGAIALVKAPVQAPGCLCRTSMIGLGLWKRGCGLRNRRLGVRIPPGVLIQAKRRTDTMRLHLSDLWALHAPENSHLRGKSLGYWLIVWALA